MEQASDKPRRIWLWEEIEAFAGDGPILSLWQDTGGEA